MLGKIAPFWIPDTEAASCMICDAKFTLVRRRHHCRACGQVLCSLCCSEKFALSHMDGKEGRVCKPCLAILARLAKAEEESANIGGGERSSAARPNPANPMEVRFHVIFFVKRSWFHDFFVFSSTAQPYLPISKLRPQEGPRPHPQVWWCLWASWNAQMLQAPGVGVQEILKV